MKIAVGSQNPVKITAVRTHIHRVWPQADIISVSVPTGVSEMPMTDDETILGATNRAIAARQAIDADLGFGLEGGVHPYGDGLILHGWVVAVDRNGNQGVSGAPRLPLPQAIANRVLAGEELGPVMDDILNDHNTRQKGGAVGALTNNLAVRGDAFALAVAYALAPFVSPSLYEGVSG